VPIQEGDPPETELPSGEPAYPDVPVSEGEWADPDATETVSDTDPAALTDFNAVLEPHGHWVEDETYGTVWVPHSSSVGSDFAPYVTRGHWALSPAGQWTWVSDYSFGWVVFHYGRWVYVQHLGWSWVPGRRYAPAWVVFRSSLYGDPYLGWAPLPPRYAWRRGRAVWLARVPPAPYVFCATRWVFHPSVGTHVLRNRQRTRALAERSRLYVPSRPTRVDRRSPNLDQARVAPGDRPSARVTRTLRAPVRTRVISKATGAAPERASAAPPKRRPPLKRRPPRKQPDTKPKKPDTKPTQRTPEPSPKATPSPKVKRPAGGVVPRRAPAKPLRKKR
jgi:hypothetical protein